MRFCAVARIARPVLVLSRTRKRSPASTSATRNAPNCAYGTTTPEMVTFFPAYGGLMVRKSALKRSCAM